MTTKRTKAPKAKAMSVKPGQHHQLSDLYVVAIISDVGGLVASYGETNKRDAIRRCKADADGRPGYRGQVSAQEGGLIYQCHADENGKVVTDEL